MGRQSMPIRKGFTVAASLTFALFAATAIAADGPGLGQKVTEADLALWDISIGPDGKGLPPGSGTAAQGAAIFAQKCEVCHGKNGQGGPNSVLINAPARAIAPWRSTFRTRLRCSTSRGARCRGHCQSRSRMRRSTP